MFMQAAAPIAPVVQIGLCNKWSYRGDGMKSSARSKRAKGTRPANTPPRVGARTCGAIGGAAPKPLPRGSSPLGFLAREQAPLTHFGVPLRGDIPLTLAMRTVCQPKSCKTDGRWTRLSLTRNNGGFVQISDH